MMAADQAAVMALGLNLVMYLAIFMIAKDLKVDIEQLNTERKDNKKRLVTDSFLKFIALIMVVLMNLSLVGFTYYFANSIDPTLGKMAFVHFMINMIGLLAIVFFVGFKMFLFPFTAVCRLYDYVDKKKGGYK